LIQLRIKGRKVNKLVKKEEIKGKMNTLNESIIEYNSFNSSLPTKYSSTFINTFNYPIFNTTMTDLQSSKY
jgi:hypothetical protein